MRLSRTMRAWLIARLPALLIVLLACGLAAPAAQAHAVLVRSVPPPDGSMAAGHATITLVYNSRVDRARSRVSLEHGQAPEVLVISQADDQRADTLTAPADLKPGDYVLHWQVLAIDGHITRGDVRFTVAAP
jgi:methionine-rich copper-binding protein CopC